MHQRRVQGLTAFKYCVALAAALFALAPRLASAQSCVTDFKDATGGKVGDGDTGPNKLQNHPVLSAAMTTGISATIDFDPNTLNKTSNGTWVVVYIELPVGYKVADINVSSVRLNGTIPAETWPYAVGDHDKDGIPDLMVKFKRSDVINLLDVSDSVPVHVTGKVGSTPFEGVDLIRVIKQ